MKVNRHHASSSIFIRFRLMSSFRARYLPSCLIHSKRRLVNLVLTLAIVFFLLILLSSEFLGRPVPPASWKPSRFVWSRGFEIQADVSLCEGETRVHGAREEVDWGNLSWPRSQHGRAVLVHVCSSSMRPFVQGVLPSIRQPFVLMTGNGDSTLPAEALGEEQVRVLVGSDLLLSWWCQNLDREGAREVAGGEKLGKLRHLPIGLDLHTRAAGPYVLGGMQVGVGVRTVLLPSNWVEKARSPQEQESMLEEIRASMRPSEERLLRVYADFQVNAKYGRRFGAGGLSRAEAAEQLRDNELVEWGGGGSRQSRELAWREKAKFAFEISLPGNGLDCHRTWEAFLLGCVVITVSSPLDEMWKELELPVVVLDGPSLSSSITADNLTKWREEHAGRVARAAERLESSMWMRRIRGAKG
eukprot:761850-Hanusia_phi.AAC.3